MTAKQTYNPMTTEGIALFVKKLAHRYHRRCEALRLKDREFDDIEQEVWMTWLKCRDGFNADNAAGSSFVNYFANSVRFNMNRSLENAVRDTVDLAPVSLQDFTNEDGEECWQDFAAIDHLDPERCLAGREALDRVWDQLSPLARYLLELRLDPPEDVRAYLAAREAHQRLKHQGAARVSVKSTVLGELPLRALIEYLDLPTRTAQVLTEELAQARRLIG